MTQARRLEADESLTRHTHRRRAPGLLDASVAAGAKEHNSSFCERTAVEAWDRRYNSSTFCSHVPRCCITGSAQTLIQRAGRVIPLHNYNNARKRPQGRSMTRTRRGLRVWPSLHTRRVAPLPHRRTQSRPWEAAYQPASHAARLAIPSLPERRVRTAAT